MEHLSFNAGQGEDGQVHHHDDELTKQERAARFLGGKKYLVKTLRARQRPAVLSLCMGETSHTVLDDHNRPVDNDAEVQCPQTHQIGAYLVGHHPRKGEQHRQGDHGRRNDGRANVAQEQE